MTYPPSPVPGVLVTGFPTPSQRSPFTYPAQLKEELLQAVPDYRVPTMEFGGPVREDRIEEYVQELIQMARARAEAALYLMHKYPWDLFVLQFQETDFLQHPLWHHLDPTHPGYSLEAHQIVVGLFRELDRHIQRVAEELSEKDVLIVLSDHGFQAARRLFSPNQWLYQRGWLKLDPVGGFVYSLFKALQRLDVLGLQQRWLSDVDREEFKRKWVKRKESWEGSEAYADATHSGCFSLYFLRGKEPAGLVEALLDVRDPETGERVVERILRAEEAFGATLAPGAPDLVAELKEGYSAILEWGRGVQLFATRKPGEHYQVGIHHPEGILIARGPDFQKGICLSSSAHLIDIAPTLLYQMNLPIPSSLDGEVISSLYEPETINGTRLVKESCESETSDPQEGRSLSRQEEEQIEKLLRDLGYLG
jgi:predicted AlkP superfamily phosphohydrolase/phosphomutase